MVKIYPSQIWGDKLPSDVISSDNPPTKGQRLSDGLVQCGCGNVVKDNSEPGLSPSCNLCWSAIALPPR